MRLAPISAADTNTKIESKCRKNQYQGRVTVSAISLRQLKELTPQAIVDCYGISAASIVIYQASNVTGIYTNNMLNTVSFFGRPRIQKR